MNKKDTALQADDLKSGIFLDTTIDKPDFFGIFVN